MTSRKVTAVIDAMEARELFAFAGGYMLVTSPANYEPTDDAPEIQISMRVVPYGGQMVIGFAGGDHDYDQDDYHEMPRRERHDVQPPAKPSTEVPSNSDTGSTNSSTTPTNTTTDQSTSTPTSGKTQVLSFNNSPLAVPEVQSGDVQKIAVAGKAENVSDIVAVKVITSPVFNESSVISSLVTKTASELSPQLMTSLASTAMATQRMLASTLLGDLRSNVTRAVQPTQSNKAVVTNDQQTATDTDDAEKEEEFTPLAMINPALLMNKTFLTRLAIGMSAFMVISYIWTRRLAQKMQSLVLKTEDDTTSFDR